jgi:hypothetical protein
MAATQQEKQVISRSIGEFALMVHPQLFDDSKQFIEILGHRIPKRSMVNRVTGNPSLRGVTLVINKESVNFVEQNPNTGKWCAELAKRGHKFMWVIGTQAGYIGYVDQPPGGVATWTQQKKF